MRSKKEELTRTFMALHYDGSTERAIDYKTALHSWWYNIRDNGGMRLTSTGFKLLKDLKFEYWDFVYQKILHVKINGSYSDLIANCTFHTTMAENV